ncbi:MAG: tRNA lysidine(34) synthetase TilS [Thermodesulfobacteriota bacterium]
MGQEQSQPDLAVRVRETISTRGLCASGDRVLLALSGGADSTTLALVMHKIAPDLELALGAAHLNHCLRGPESDRDEEFVRRLAWSLELPFFSGREDVAALARAGRVGLEEAGRDIRRAFLCRVAKENGYSAVALGHHADDAAETVLMALVRGSGLTGLSGIPAKEGMLIRPLIDLTRDDILGFLADEGAAWREDGSNRDMRFLRNRVRHQVLPLLRRAANPAVSRALVRLAGLAAAEEEFWGRYADSFVEGRGEGNAVRMDASRLAGLSLAEQRRVFRRAYERFCGGMSGLSADKTDAAIALCRECGEEKEVHLGDSRVAVLRGGFLVLESRPRGARNRPAKTPDAPRIEMAVPGPGVYPIPGRGQALQIALMPRPEEGAPWLARDAHRVFLDADRFSFPAVLRSLLPGDRFRPLNSPGSRKAARFLQDRKADRRARAEALVLVSGGGIAWLAPHCPDHSFRVTDNTRTILQARLLSPEEMNKLLLATKQ